MNAKELEQKARQIHAEQNRQLAALRGSDGKPLYMPQEEQRRREEIQAQTSQKLTKLVEEARGDADYREALLMIDLPPLRRSPLLRLSSLDQQQAAALAPFIKEDVERASYVDLRDRLKFAGSAVEKALLARYIGHRLEDDQRAAYEAGDRPDRPWYDLSQALEDFSADLIPEEERKKLARLEEREKDIDALRLEAEQVEQWAPADAKRDFAARFGLDERNVQSPYEREEVA